MHTQTDGKRLATNALLMGLGLSIAGLTFVMTGLSSILASFSSGGSIDWGATLVVSGALLCAVGGYVVGRGRAERGRSSDAVDGCKGALPRTP